MTKLLAILDSRVPGRASRPRALLVGFLVLAVAGGVVLAVQAAVRPEPRQVTLIARDMAFYLPGDPIPNPRLLVARGEEVRLVLRNGDHGIPHDLALPTGDGERKSTRQIRGAGESAVLTFRAPEAPGELEYVCTLHARMMRGVLEVR
jgi:copper binding plastocyanin/azurin family protein